MPGCPDRVLARFAVAATVAVAGLAVPATSSGAAPDGAWIRLAQAAPADPADPSGAPTPPVRLMPPGGTPADAAEPAKADDPEPAAAAGTAQPDPEGVTTTALSALDTASIGLLDAEQGGLGVALWQGSERALIEKLLPRLPARTRSAAAQKLAIRLLSTRAKAPQGESNGPDLLTSRISRMVELGAVDAASRLADQVSVEQTGEQLARSAVEALFLQNDNAGACQRVRDFARRSVDAYWQRAFAFCLLLSGEGARAEMIVDVLAERGGESAELFSELIETLRGSEAAAVESLPDPSGLDLAMMRAANTRLPADVLSSDRPAVLRSVATSPNADLDLRLEAGERALVYGAIDADRMNELYAAVQWEDAELADPAATAEGIWGPRGRALLLRAAASAEDPAAKASTLGRAFQLARERGGYHIMAAASVPALASIPPDAALAGFAPDAVSVLLAAGRLEPARAWLALAGGDAGPDTASEADTAADAGTDTGPEAGTRAEAMPGGTSPRLWAIGVLAAAENPAGVDEAALAAWRGAAFADDTEAGRRAEIIALSLLEALGVTASPGRWAELLAEGPPPRVAAPDIAWARALEESSAAGRAGETVLIALLGLAGSNAAAPGTAAMRMVVKSLRRVGLETEARAFALEAAVAHGL